MRKQLWLFLTEQDEAELLEQARARGARLLCGRFFRGDPQLLRTEPESLETTALRRGEQVTHLLYPADDAAMVVHPVTDGPLAGWSRLDDVRSEVMTLVRPLPEPQGLAPAQLQASTHAWFGGQRLRKSHGFGRWVVELLGLAAAHPATQYDWLHVAPGARAWAESGGTLRYLYQPVRLDPGEATRATRPHMSHSG